MNLLLIGARGSGKSTVGRQLADRLECPFVDLDTRVISCFDESTVREIFDTHGEQAWREAETRMLVVTLIEDGQVVALGGGTPMIPEARDRIESDRLAGRTRVIYLRCEVEVLSQRLAHHAGDRPSLTGADLVEEVHEILRQREATYRQLANLVLDVTDTSVGQAADSIYQFVDDSP